MFRHYRVIFREFVVIYKLIVIVLLLVILQNNKKMHGTCTEILK